MPGLMAVYYREMLILRRRFKRQISGMAVLPLLYLLTFGYALGSRWQIEGRSYLEFLLPGLAAMSSMTQAFSLAIDINVARFYFHAFEEIQAAPVSPAAYVLGEIMAGLTRVLLATLVIIGLGFIFGLRLHYGPLFWAGIFLNAFIFSALAVAVAMLVKSHADQGLLVNFIITPMAFLGGTFFPLESLPLWAQKILAFLPLSQAAAVIRGEALGLNPPPAALAPLLAGAVFALLLAVFSVAKARD